MGLKCKTELHLIGSPNQLIHRSFFQLAPLQSDANLGTNQYGSAAGPCQFIIAHVGSFNLACLVIMHGQCCCGGIVQFSELSSEHNIFVRVDRRWIYVYNERWHRAFREVRTRKFVALNLTATCLSRKIPRGLMLKHTISWRREDCPVITFLYKNGAIQLVVLRY